MQLRRNFLYPVYHDIASQHTIHLICQLFAVNLALKIEVSRHYSGMHTGIGTACACNTNFLSK
jgi:hypothetical protein